METTSPVMSISDEQIAEIEAQCEAANKHDGSLIVGADEVSALISRLRAAEMDAEKWRARQAKVLRKRPAIDAALDSICVELPQCDPSEAVQYGAALDDFKQALTAAGVPYK